MRVGSTQMPSRGTRCSCRHVVSTCAAYPDHQKVRVRMSKPTKQSVTQRDTHSIALSYKNYTIRFGTKETQQRRASQRLIYGRNLHTKQLGSLLISVTCWNPVYCMNSNTQGLDLHLRTPGTETSGRKETRETQHECCGLTFGESIDNMHSQSHGLPRIKIKPSLHPLYYGMYTNGR